MKNFVKAIAFVSLSMCLPVQQAQEAEKTGRHLEIYLAPRSSTGCVGDKNLIVDVLVVNEGQDEQPLDIGKYHAVLSFSTVSSGSAEDNTSGGMSLMPDRIGGHPASKVVILGAHAVYKAELSIPLTDPFFSHAGLYLAMPSITIGNVSKPAAPKQGLILQLLTCR
jgi:hypothetical protein